MCTGISYTSSDKNQFLGRTQEYNKALEYCAVQFPIGYNITTAAEPWTTLYSVLGAGVKYEDEIFPGVVDGINEHGLACSTQYFDDNVYAEISEIESSNKKAVYSEQFIFYLLSTCKTIEEVVGELDKLAIPKTTITNELATPQHFFIKDLSGNSIVVEPSEELTFKIFQNEVGVMTNSPSFDWHLENLRNYNGMSSTSIKNGLFDSIEKNSLNGSGLLGLPGDFTAPSRFIKASVLLSLAESVPSVDAINMCFHILSMSDIPKGVKVWTDSIEYTQYTVVYDQTKKEMYIKFYDNLNIQKIKFDFEKSKSTTPSIYELTTKPTYINLN